MNQANKRIKALLSRIFEGASAEELGSDREGVTRLSLAGRFGSVRLSAVWIGTGWPADVLQAFARLRSPWPDDLVFAGQRMSPGAIRLLEERKANWADEAGNARIASAGIVVIRDGTSKAKAPPSLSWSPSAVAIAEALLAGDWSAGVRTTELANLAQRSPGSVSSVLQRFDEEGWTVKYGAQRGSSAVRELADAAGLLDAWAAVVASQGHDLRLAHRTMRSPLGFLENELAEALNKEVRWSLTGWAAAHLIAPMSDTVPSLQIYVHEDDFEQPLDRAIENAGLADVAEGGRVAFYLAHPSVLALGQQRPIGSIASTPRVYADLLAMGGRGEDAAAHLKEEALESARSRSSRRLPPVGMVEWERDCRERLQQLASAQPELAEAYAQGIWSASYRLAGVPEPPGASKFLGILREVADRSSGWPAWMTAHTSRDGPRPVEDMIECWLSDTSVFDDAAHADYWRADPRGRLCLIRGYQEDSALEQLAAEPGTRLDLTLPIWRTGECLRHAGRLARRLDASSIQFMMRWSGLKGRRLAAMASRRHLPPTRPTLEDEVVSFVELTPAEIDADLAATVRLLVEPLFACFDFFEPPPEIYDEELTGMLHRAEG